MIKRYSDHAANERTFLAWVRSAVAIMAFGFVIERFDLFLQRAVPQLALKQFAPHGQAVANAAGLAFILLGVAIIAIAGFRFMRTSKEIDAEETVPSLGERFDFALAALIGLLGVAVFLYMWHAVLPGSETPAVLNQMARAFGELPTGLTQGLDVDALHTDRNRCRWHFLPSAPLGPE